MNTLPVDHERMIKQYAADSQTHMAHSNISNIDRRWKVSININCTV